MSETETNEQTPDARSVVGDRFGFLFAKMHQRCARLSVDELEKAGLGLSGMHMGALAMIETAGPLSQNEVGSALGKDRTTMVSVVDDLERAGLVERHRNPRDRRAYALEVTEKGREWHARAVEVLGESEGDLLAGLDRDEREVLRGLLQRVVFDGVGGRGRRVP